MDMPVRATLHSAALVTLVAAVVLIDPPTRLRGQTSEGGGAHASRNWPVVAGNVSSSRYSALTEINTDTIDRLGGAWVTRLEGGVSSRATPVVQDDVIGLRRDSGELPTLASNGWDHSVWVKREVSLASEDKVHVSAEFERFNADDESLGVYQALHIVTNVDGHWGVQSISTITPYWRAT